MNSRYKTAWEYTRNEIDILTEGGNLPLYQGVCDIAGALNFHEIAATYNLTGTEYNNLINKAQKYTDKWIFDTYFKIK
jgi:hypothetical protein